MGDYYQTLNPAKQEQEIKIEEQDGMEGESHYNYEKHTGENGKFIIAKCDRGPCQDRERQYFNNLKQELSVDLAKDGGPLKVAIQMKEMGKVMDQGDDKEKAGAGHLWENGGKWESNELEQKIKTIVGREDLDWQNVPDTKLDRGGNKTVEHKTANLENDLQIHLFSITAGKGQGHQWACLEVPHKIKINEDKKKLLKFGLGLVIEQGEHRFSAGNTHIENLGMEDCD